MGALKCNRCGAKAFYLRMHSGESLCENCFRRSIERIVSRTLASTRLLTPSEKIVVVSSGGTYALAGLYLTWLTEKRFPEVELKTIIIDEPYVKPRYINPYKIATSLSEKLGLEFIVTHPTSIGHDCWETRIRTAVEIALQEGFTTIIMCRPVEEDVAIKFYRLLRYGLSNFIKHKYNIKIINVFDKITFVEAMKYGRLLGLPLFVTWCGQYTKIYSYFLRLLKYTYIESPTSKFALKSSLETIEKAIKGAAGNP